MSGIAKRLPASFRRPILKRLHDGQIKNVIVEDKRTVGRMTTAMKQRKYQVKTLRSWAKQENGLVSEAINKLADRLELQKLHEVDMITGYKAYSSEIGKILQALKTEDKLEDKLKARKKDLKAAQKKLKDTKAKNEKSAKLPDFDKKEAERQEDFCKVAVRTAEDGVDNAKKTLSNAEEETEKAKVAQLKAGMLYLSQAMMRYHQEAILLAKSLEEYAENLEGNVAIEEIELCDKEITRGRSKSKSKNKNKNKNKEEEEDKKSQQQQQQQQKQQTNAKNVKPEDDKDKEEAEAGPEVEPSLPGAVVSSGMAKAPVQDKPKAGVTADVSGAAAQVA